jgi:hypothetical protein
MSESATVNFSLDWANEGLASSSSLSTFLQQQKVRAVSKSIIDSFRNSQFLRVPLQKAEATEAELSRLWHLEKNWDSYGADAPNHAAIGAAREFLHEVAKGKLDYKRILPSAEGGVAVAFFHEEKRAIAEFLNDGTKNLILYEKSGAVTSLEPAGDSPMAFLDTIRAFLFGGRDQ